jgi:hypothetical protein
MSVGIPHNICFDICQNWPLAAPRNVDRLITNPNKLMRTMKHIEVGESRDILLALYQDIRMIFKQFGYKQAAGSPADHENKLIGEPQGITGILSQVWILWEASSDHVLAAIKTLSEPVQTICRYGSYDNLECTRQSV